MKYLIDTNRLKTHIKKSEYNLCITRDVYNEYVADGEEKSKIKDLSIRILDLNKKHYERLKQVLVKHGDNKNLINLWDGKGTADVTSVAFILAEKENPDSLFSEEYCFVTNDNELFGVCRENNIYCLRDIPNND